MGRFKRGLLSPMFLNKTGRFRAVQGLVKCDLDFQCKPFQVLSARLVSVIAVCQVCIQSVQKTNVSTGGHCFWYLLAKQSKNKADIPTKLLDNFFQFPWTLIINYNFFLHVRVFHCQVWVHAELGAGKSSSSTCVGLIKAKAVTEKYWAPELPLLSAVPLVLPFPCPYSCETPCPLSGRPGLCQQPGQKVSVKGDRRFSCWPRDPVISENENGNTRRPISLNLLKD